VGVCGCGCVGGGERDRSLDSENFSGDEFYASQRVILICSVV